MIINPIKSNLVKLSFKKSQAIKADVAGIKKNIETVLLAELFFIRYIKIVKAPKENGKASFDANGMVEVYRVKGDDVVVKIPGVVDKGTVDKANLTSSNGYYSAVIVSDKLAADQGGEGTDVLIGVEGLVFNWSNDQYLQHVHEGDSNISLTKLAVDYKAEEYKTSPQTIDDNAPGSLPLGTMLKPDA